MHRILILLTLTAFSVEEIAHQRGRRAGTLPAAPSDAEVKKHTLDIFDILRLLELLFITLLLSSQAGNLAGPHGQISIILLGLQASRLFGRRILSSWSVLGVLQAFEIVMLLLLLIVPLNATALEKPPLTTAGILGLAGGIIYAVIITICAAFSLSYGIKLFSRESSPAFDNFPPLADSENWAVIFSRKSMLPGIAGTAGLFLISGLSILPFLFLLSVMLCGGGLVLSRRSSFTGHHPISHLLWGLSFLLIMVMIVSGITDLTGS